MSELDQVWSNMLDEASTRASNAGRHDVAEYLRLRATNDAIRRAGVVWLMDSMIEIAAHATRERRNLTIEREEPHNFAVGSSNMVGSRLKVSQGVRCLAIEAGWARTPSDGIMRNGSLAFARISHFGLSKAGAELRLVHAESLPQWLGPNELVIDTTELRRHFDYFVGS